MTTVSLNNIVKLYGKQEVVHCINLEIKSGEFVVLVGPSGCAKSTTLRMIAGLEDISSGTISIGDRVVNDLPPRDRNISMVFQNYALYPHMNVAENLGFSLKIAKIREDEIFLKVKEVSEILGLEDLMDRRPAELSGGQRQRVAMGRAIVRNPDVFLFDEPLSNLDAKLRTQMRVEIKKLHNRLENTIIYVTHDQTEAMTLADRIVLMQDGNIVQVGTPLELFDEPVNTFVATFIGSPPMNLIEAVVKGNDIILDNSLTVPIPKNAAKLVTNGQKVIFGFRADHLTPTGHNVIHDEKSAKFDLTVTLTESLGTESILYTRIGSVDVQTKMFNPRPVAIGEILNFQLSIDKCHLFDAQTGDAIRG